MCCIPFTQKISVHSVNKQKRYSYLNLGVVASFSCYQLPVALLFINNKRLLHDIFHIGPGISPRLPYQSRQRSWRADMGRGLIPGTIWKISCHNLFITYVTFSKHWLLYCKKDLWIDKLYTIIVFCWGQYEFLWTLKTIFTEAFRLRWILISKVHKNSHWPIQKTVIVLLH